MKNFFPYGIVILELIIHAIYQTMEGDTFMGPILKMISGKIPALMQKNVVYIAIRFDEIAKDEINANGALKWIMELMEYADDNYYRIFTINDFFEETLEHLNDYRYLALWKIYDEMLHDSEMEEAGSVIFVPDEPEYENKGFHYWGEQRRRRLIGSWSSIDIDKRDNKARVTLRRYMALAANRKLREKILGF